MRPFGWERAAVVRLLLLLCFAPLGVFGQFEILGSRLLRAGEPFVARGVVYANGPIGAPVLSTLGGSSCLYARDVPLIAGLGANTIRTRQRVSPADPVLLRSLEKADLYLIAGFPVSEVEVASERDAALGALSSYADAWARNDRLLAISIDGPPTADFYQFLGEAAVRLHAEQPGLLVTSSVESTREIGAFDRSTQDGHLPALDFWSLDLSGHSALSPALEEAAGKTAKPILLSGFGVDAYDQFSGAADFEGQSLHAELLAQELDALVRAGAYSLLGGLYAELTDQWSLGGPDPSQHGAAGRAAPASPDGFYNAAWAGLFGLRRSGAPGLDALRLRPAYHALAAVWSGFAPPELSLADPPAISSARNAASGGELLAPATLFEIAGESLAGLPAQTLTPADPPYFLGATSVCFDGAASPLYLAEPGLVRGVTPASTRNGAAQAIVFRAGAASAPAAVEVRPAAPGILPNGVFRPGLPCPVNQANGVPPGAYLELYGSGLGAGAEPPLASLGEADVPVVYSGPVPGAPGLSQTNVRIPVETPPGAAELRLSQAGVASNPHRLQILGEQDVPDLSLGPSPAQEIVIQQGGPAQTVFLDLQGFNGFCSLVRFEIAGLPPGVQASLPVALPGQRVPLTVWAEANAVRAQAAEVIVTAVSTLPRRPAQTFRVSVLPGSGDVRLRVVSGGWLTGEPEASFALEDRVLYRVHGGGPGRGFNFLTLDPQTGTIGQVRHFDTWASDEAVTAMETYLRGLPRGVLVLGAVADDGTLKITEQTRALIAETLGATQIELIQYQWSWAILSRVGAERPMAEGMDRDERVELDRTVSFPLP